MPHGGEILAQCLAVNGVERVFCVPGESFLAALDGLYDAGGIETVVCRNEGGVTMMADAHAKLTGQPGVAFVTRGPGATNGSIGIHIAHQDSSPLVLFVGLPALSMVDRECFQEFDFVAFFKAIAKDASIVPSADRIAEYVSRAFHTAENGRPGPVVVGLPEDVISQVVDTTEPLKPTVRAQQAPGADTLALVDAALSRAERPFVLVGGPKWSDAARLTLERLAEREGLPVGTAFRCQDYFDNNHPSYAGHVGIGADPHLIARMQEADVLLVLGARLGEMTTGGYAHLSVPNADTYLIHVHPNPDELGRVYRADLAVAAETAAFVTAWEARSPAPDTTSDDDARQAARRADTAAHHARFEAFTTPLNQAPASVDTNAKRPAVLLDQIVTLVSESLADNAIITNGAGNYAGWVHRYHRYRRYRTQLAPTAGAMGYGVPAAIAAKLAHPDREVIAFAGDGCFLMNGQELATAHQYGANIIVIVVNNGMYGTIRMHQEREYPARVMATTLVNPDFAAMAQAFGGVGFTVTRTSEFRDAFEAARAADSFALIEVRTDPNQITPTTTIDAIRAEA